jgi:hypothetical protein
MRLKLISKYLNLQPILKFSYENDNEENFSWKNKKIMYETKYISVSDLKTDMIGRRTYTHRSKQNK